MHFTKDMLLQRNLPNEFQDPFVDTHDLKKPSKFTLMLGFLPFGRFSSSCLLRQIVNYSNFVQINANRSSTFNFATLSFSYLLCPILSLSSVMSQFFP